MPYIVECTFEPRPTGLNFYLRTSVSFDSDCELCVTFQPTAYYPAERDIGVGADFDARIVRIEIRGADEADNEKAWYTLEPREAEMAKKFLEEHHSKEMWEQAFDETAEAFGQSARWAA
jgi:hypothetical protein